jgi:hypothetical protein
VIPVVADDVALVEDAFLLFLVDFFVCLVDGLAIDSFVVVVAVVVVVAGAAEVAAGAGAGAVPWAAAVAAKARATRAVRSLLMKRFPWKGVGRRHRNIVSSPLTAH